MGHVTLCDQPLQIFFLNVSVLSSVSLTLPRVITESGPLASKLWASAGQLKQPLIC